MKRLCAYIVFLIMSFAGLYSQHDNTRFQNFNLEDGLSHSLVADMVEDDLGFLWFGTQDGLNRFDGYSFKIYYPGKGNTSPSNRWIRSLFKDSRNQIWIIYSSEGIERFDPEKELFYNYTPDSLNPRSISSNESPSGGYPVYCFEDSDKRVWIGTAGGLNRYNSETDDFDVFIHDPDDPFSLSGDEVTYIAEDFNRNIWIGTKNGLNYFSLDENKMFRFSGNPETGQVLAHNYITHIYPSDENTIFIGTFEKGVAWVQHPLENEKLRIHHYLSTPINKNREATVFNILKTSKDAFLIVTESGLYRLFPHQTGFREELIEITKGTRISTIYEDSRANIWAASQGGTAGRGLLKFNGDLSAFDFYTKNKLDKYSLTQNKINFIKETSQGMLVIGSERDGFFVHNLHAKKFMHIDEDQEKFLSLTNSEVYAILVDENKNLWAGTKGGLNKVNLVTGERSVYERKEGFVTGVDYIYSPHISGNLVGVIESTKDNQLWLGYFDFKVSLFDPDEGIFLNFEHNKDNPASFLNWSMRSICVTKAEEVYFGGSQHGLCKLNDDGKSFSYFPVNSGKNDGTNDEWIHTIVEDRQGNLWMGTMTGGLNKYNTATGRFSYFTHSENNPEHSIPSNQVRCILQPEIYHKDHLWVGTNSGFSKFYEKDSSFFTFTMDEGLPSNVIHGILEDNIGMLWISTNKGLVLFDPVTENFKVFTEADGLQGNEFVEGSYFKSKDGILYFGGTNGITYFDPGQIEEDPFESNVVITDIKLYNKSVGPNDTVNNHRLLSSSISYTDEIILKPGDKVVSFEFANLAYISPEKVRYRYMLEPFESNWNEVGSDQRFANYTNIPSGEYILKINSTNNDNKWNEQAVELRVNVLPHFWETNWFKFVVTTSIIFIFFLLLSLRTQSLKRQKKRLAAEVNARTKELLEANELLEKNQVEISKQSQKISIQRDNLREQNLVLEKKEKEVREMAEKLHESDQMKLKFFTNISHEFRTPLTLMLGPTEKLLKQSDYKNAVEIKQYLYLIFKNEKRLLKLINQLLEIRKVETGNLKLRVSKEDLISFIDSLYQIFRPLAEKKNIDFRFEKKYESNSLLIYFDQDKIEKILYNLLSNAFKHTSEGGKISLRIQKAESEFAEMVSISVEDSGRGISEDHLPHIFDRFFQLAGKAASGDFSSGIGLSLSRDLAEAHHGKIEVKSVENEGTVFTLSIPVNKEVYKAEEIIQEESQDYMFEQTKAILEDSGDCTELKFEPHIDKADSLKILVVEDNQDMQKFLFRELSMKYNVLTADDGAQGILLAREYLPDLIISDIMMPEKDGFELCREIKSAELTSHIPVFLLTAKTESENQVKGYEFGADDYILKPFSSEILQHKINNLLKSRALMADRFKSDSDYIPKNIKISQIDQGFLEKFVKIVEDNLDDPELSGDRIAAELFMSKGNLYKKLKALNGMSVNIYVRTIRLKIAAKLLKSGTYNISDVAYAVGFNNPKYFSTCFSEQFSVSPKEYMSA